MNFTTAQKVLETIRQGDDVAWARSENRVKINQAANNEPLMDDEEAEKIGLKIFNRWGEHMQVLAHARRQFMQNFFGPSTFFTIDIPKAPEEVRADWSGTISEWINNLMKEGDSAMDYFSEGDSKWSAVACHGIGPLLFEDKYDWLPRMVAIGDLRIATDTLTSFRNLDWFAVRIPYTPGELYRKAFSKVQSKWKWNKESVKNLLKSVEEINTVMADNNYNFETDPEKFESLRKQNGGYWSGDAMPVINLWHFYHTDDNRKWTLKIVPETAASSATGADENEFVCEYEGVYADHWREILHVQYGDLNSDAPFLYHEVRSLGYSLYEPCYWTDLTRCRFIQHVQDQFNILLRNSDPVDKARASIQVFQNMGVLRPGVSIVPAAERHQIEGGLVDSALGQLKQLQSEAGTAYTQDTDTGTRREQTAFETGVKVQQTNAMLSGILMKAAVREKFLYKEICRRLCLKKTLNEDAKRFQSDMAKAKIPAAWLDVSKWIIEPTLPLGNGNPTMAFVEAQAALEMRPLASPAAQQEMAHDAAVAKLGSRRARRWFSMKEKAVSSSTKAAADSFPIIMLGLLPQVEDGTNMIQFIGALEGYTLAYITKIERSQQKLATPAELVGLNNAAGVIAKYLSSIQGDQANEATIKQYAHSLSQIQNGVKKLSQHAEQAAMKAQMQQNGQEMNGKIMAHLAETKAKIQGKQAETMVKLKSKELSEQQKLRHKNAAFVADQQRQNLQTVLEGARKSANPEGNSLETR